jgi:hypothetical protein
MMVTLPSTLLLVLLVLMEHRQTGRTLSALLAISTPYLDPTQIISVLDASGALS